MGVFLNKTFDDGSTVALWRITESEGKSLSEQRFAVDALIDNVFKGKYRLCHDSDGIPVLEVADDSKAIRRNADASRVPKKADSPVPFVSVSHTKGWVAVVTNPKEHVGIDIELCNRDFSAVGKKAISNHELARLDDWAEVLRDSLPADTDDDPSETASALNPRNTVLGLLWCAKEAVYKRLTVPATDFAEQIEIESITPASPANTKEKPEHNCSPATEGKITAKFKHGNAGPVKIPLGYTLLPELILVHTIG